MGKWPGILRRYNLVGYISVGVPSSYVAADGAGLPT